MTDHAIASISAVLAETERRLNVALREIDALQKALAASEQRVKILQQAELDAEEQRVIDAAEIGILKAQLQASEQRVRELKRDLADLAHAIQRRATRGWRDVPDSSPQ
jgi:chromosome segregation ATPase